MTTHTVYAPEITWEATTDFPGSAETKVLRHEGGRQARTVLIRLHAGGRVSPHSHIGTVQHYVVEGAYEAEGRTYAAGTYRLFEPHAVVPELSARQGATILMVYDPVA